MARDTGIANRLRAYGLNVVEVAGWQTRGSSTFNPRGLVDHHTAGSPRGNAPSLNVCIHGRSGLSGPLCNVLIGRDNTCYVIAAGRANHAGKGGWNGLRYNSSVYGVERENVGTSAEPWRPDQHLWSAVVDAALMEGKNLDNVCRHAEWAPTRKIDTHDVNGNDLRSLVKTMRAKHGGGTPAPPAPIDWEAIIAVVAACSKKTLKRGSTDGCVIVLQRLLNAKAGQGLVDDGDFGPKTEAAVKNVQRFFGQPEDGIADPRFWGLLQLEAAAPAPKPEPAPSSIDDFIKAIEAAARVRPTLRRGMKSAKVKDLQAILNAVDNSKLAVDGMFGAGTYTAVISFQRSRKLQADGIVGFKTWSHLIAESF